MMSNTLETLPKAFCALAFLIAANACIVSAHGEDSAKLTPPVVLDSGPIRGEIVDAEVGIRAFRGIPFAAPPTGELRWKPPQSVRPWKEMRTCVEFGPSCPQPTPPRNAPVKTPKRKDEDCLYLNVWTRAKQQGEKLPVMLWIHGGGCTTGAASLGSYDGTEFARAGVVLVTTNYRLGPFGFLAHPALSAESSKKVSGNYGILDQIAALKWVQRNIKAFGGDPENVTIFGESAGGVCCNTLMLSPLAKGLFHRAILQSGVVITSRARLRDGEENAERQGETLAKKLGAADLAAMRAKTPQELLAAAKPRVGLMGKGTKFGPVADGYVLPDVPMKCMLEGKQHQVPVMLCSNADEGTLFLFQMPIRRVFGYKLMARFIFKDKADEVLALFPAQTDAQARPALCRLITVSAFVQPTRAVARLHSRSGAPTYLYHFTRVTPAARLSGLGATHGIEIVYVFGTYKKGMGTETDRRLADNMRRAWVRFAATGDPNHKGLVKWPRYSAEADQHLEFGDTIRVSSKLKKKECDVFDRYMYERAGISDPFANSHSGK